MLTRTAYSYTFTAIPYHIDQAMELTISNLRHISSTRIRENVFGITLQEGLVYISYWSSNLEIDRAGVIPYWCLESMDKIWNDSNIFDRSETDIRILEHSVPVIWPETCRKVI